MALGQSHRSGFTIVEIAVVLIVCGVLVAIVAPVVGGARNNSYIEFSLNNLKNIHTALTTYAGDYNDRQPTWVVDDLSTYGPSAEQATSQYYAVNGESHPWLWLGACNDLQYGFATPPNVNQAYWLNPIKFATGVAHKTGSSRLPNAKIIHDYIGGKFQSPEFFAPGDRTVYPRVEPLMDHPCSYYNYWFPTSQMSSYFLSAAAMYDPDVLRKPSLGGYQNPYSYATGLKSPSVSAATYPNLKTRLMEHHWNQEAPDHPCYSYAGDGCTPYLFNHGLVSQPATLFFDGSTRLLPNAEAIAADEAVLKQSGGVDGLWHRGTPFGVNGYFSEFALDGTTTSHHVLTTEGIKGRDTIASK